MKANSVFILTGAALVIAIALGFLWLWSVSGARDSGNAADDVVARLMQRKDVAAARIGAGLAKSDFSRAERGVSELVEIGAASNWFLPDQRYSRLSDEFRRALDQLSAALAARDVPQSQAAYAQVMNSCIACHQQVGASGTK